MEYLATVTILVAIFVILAASYNLVIGYGGLSTVAHPIFFAIGAYASGLLAIHTTLPPVLAISVGLAVVSVLAIRAIVNGPYGRAITAMRDEELAFTALGRNAMSMKIVIFAIGCGIAGIAGGIYAYYFQYISPDQFEVLQSAAILTMVVLGGMGTTYGPVVGAVLLLAVPQAITFLRLPPSIMAPTQGIIFTMLVLLFLFLRPAGIMGISAKARR